jgi:hypothetical protein
VLPILKRNGFKTSVYDIAPQILFTALLKDAIAETILKAKQTSLLAYYLQSPYQKIIRNWQAVKVCLKSNYIITDYTIWEDYISLLQWFKKDLSCPFLVCPENLHEAHNKLVAKKRELQRKKYLLKMRAEILSAQETYTEEKKQFFGLCFTNENLTIKVLENVKDFMEEGDTLQHCIFTNEYFKKKNSLLFSAQIDNTPVETIAISLSKMEIVQCRGMKNNKSKHHKVILNLMKKNLYRIHSRMKKEKAIKAEKPK